MDSILAALAKYNNKNTNFFSLTGITTWARVVDLYDGDTLTCVVPLHNCFYKFQVRLMGIDTCEMHSKNEKNKVLANQAKKELLELITGKTDLLKICPNRNCLRNYFDNNVHLVYIECEDFDKYGRLLAKVYKDDSKQHLSVNEILVSLKLAYPYLGQHKLSESEQLLHLCS